MVCNPLDVRSCCLPFSCCGRANGVERMIFPLLALVASCFGLLGFLLHSFCFSKHGLVESLKQEIQHLERMLEVRKEENANTRQEVEKTGIPVQLLERQLEEKSKLVNSFGDTARRQEDQIQTFSWKEF